MSRDGDYKLRTTAAHGSLNCPACGAGIDHQPAATYTADQAAAHFCPPSRNPDRYERLRKAVVEIWQGDSSHVFFCSACGFGFGWPHAGGNESYYGILHEQAGYPANRWEYGWTIREVVARATEGGTLLDIGTGDGAFLQQLPPGWHKAATEGSETNREMLRQKGIECFESLDTAASSHAGQFDVVTMFQVLEHIADFRTVLRGIWTLLRPGGTLVVSVPLASAMRMQEELTGWPDITPNHINKWSPEALETVFASCGFMADAPIEEPPGFRHAMSRVELITRRQAAASPGSLAARAFRLRSRAMRRYVLAGITAVNLLGCIPLWKTLSRGSSFVLVGMKMP
ncbi:MAG: hypothetical protein RLZZ21_1761 [Planctomycetota bacterium]|jgi:SAM-dependent methyltransferase